MWTSVALASPSSEALAERLGRAKSHLRVTIDDEDALIEAYLLAAIQHVEAVTGTRLLAAQGVLTATDWTDLLRPPVAPIGDAAVITYVPRGASEPATLSPAALIIRADPLQPALYPAQGEVWPDLEPGHPITVTATFGYDVAPASCWQAVLLLIGQWYRNRMTVVVGTINSELPHGVYPLLENHRRYLV